MQGLDLEKTGSGRAASDLFFGGFPNRFHFQAQAQGNAVSTAFAIIADNALTAGLIIIIIILVIALIVKMRI